MALPPSPDKPRTFTGDPNPPVEAPEPITAPKAVAGPSTSAGTGALPPEASTGLGQAQSVSATEGRYRIAANSDGTPPDIYFVDKDGDTKVGVADAEDAHKILSTVGHYDEKNKIWDNVDPKIAKSLMSGRLGFPEEIAKAWEGGEAGVVQAFNAMAWIDGKMSFDEAKARNEQTLLKDQLASNGAPSFAWSKLGDYAADALKHPVDALLSAGKYTVKQLAGFAPMAAQVAGGAMEGAVKVGGPAGAAALATGTMELPPVAAGVAWLTSAGATAGAAKTLINLETGGAASRMMQQGLPENVIRDNAVYQGAVKGVLWMTGAKFIPAPGKTMLFDALASSPAAQKLAANWIVKYGGEVAAGTGLMVVQEKVRQIFNNMAATAAQRPDLLIGGEEGLNQLLDAGVAGLAITGVMGAPGAIEGALKGPPKTVTAEAEGGRGAEPVLAIVESDEAHAAAEQDRRGRWFSKAGPKESPYSNIPGKETRYVDVKTDEIKQHEHGSFYLLPRGEAESGIRLLKGEEELPVRPGFTRLYRAADPAEPAANKYVIDRPFSFEAGETDKGTAKDMRETLVGHRNEQIARVNQFAESIKRAVPDKGTQLAMRWYAEAQGDAQTLGEWADEPKLAPYREEIKAAMKLPEAAKAQVEEGNAYFKEVGDVAKEHGVIKELRDNYLLNHVYLPEEPKDFVKNEMSAGLRRSTSHSLGRTFDTLADAVIGGDKKIAPIGYADLIGLHGTEMARVIEVRKFLDATSEAGLGGWHQEGPVGWRQVGQLEKRATFIDKDGNPRVTSSKFYAPAGIAKGLEAVTDPNFMTHVDSLRGLQRYQMLVKTVDLSYSLFHHMSLLAATLNEGDLNTLKNLPWSREIMATAKFQEQERFAALHNVMTNMVQPNLDALRSAAEKKGDYVDKFTQLPGIKQGLEQSDRNAKFLFDNWARFMKVNDFTRLAANIAADHPTATDAELTPLFREAARHVNSTYGGLNWEAMGATKTELAVARLAALAPDWLTSNALFMKQALTEGGVAGSASRWHLARAIGSALAATETLSLLANGRTSFTNKKGHEFEFEASPDVYISFLRGGPGELLKVASLLHEMPAEAPGRYAQAKGSPLLRGGVEFVTGRKPNGAPVVPAKDKGTAKAFYDVVKELFLTAGPVPFGVANLTDYAHSGKATAMGTLLVATGIGRYMPPRKEQSRRLGLAQ